MTSKHTADESARPPHKQANNSSTAQRTRLPERLRFQPVDIITARSELNIMMQAARVKELSDRGHNIRHHLIALTDDHGRCHHRVAQYFLSITSVKVEV